MISAEEYEAMRPAREMSFEEYLLSLPAWPDDVADAINDRSKDTGRIIDF